MRTVPWPDGNRFRAGISANKIELGNFKSDAAGEAYALIRCDAAVVRGRKWKKKWALRLAVAFLCLLSLAKQRK
jgi:hypothetical protein